MNSKQKVLVLISGGLDSATSLYWAKKKFDKVQAITFNYFDRINNEKIATRKILKLAQISLIEVNIPFLKERMTCFNFKMKPADHPSQSYIPFRNLIFYSISGYFAQVNKIKYLVGGHNATDGKIFKDATGSYFGKMNELMTRGMLGHGKCKILLPLKGLSRIGVIQLAKNLDVPVELTWSCHRNGKNHCGQCYACKQRLNAFNLLGSTDPVSYSTCSS